MGGATKGKGRTGEGNDKREKGVVGGVLEEKGRMCGSEGGVREGDRRKE